ncbi:hypothetical protein WJX73_000262 [Symbiochloris irregularis]|uniref:TauD/TfdA-like domain-containing protein n=1 Tax=Symbiochloris irregularis TaxID=706552 RepID=A0AAW1PR67_9CHLO
MASAAVLGPRSIGGLDHPADRWLSKSPAGYQENPAPKVVPFETIKGPTVWYSDLPKDKYEYRLTDADVADLDKAISHVKAQGIEKIETITRADFELGKLGVWLDDLHRELLYGIGLRVVRGLPVERWGLRDTQIALWGLGLYLGKAVSQNSAGHLIGHVRDTRDSKKPLQFNRNTGELRKHSDNSDIVILLCYKPAKSGGGSSWCSSHALHNELLEQHPDLHRVLAEPVYQVRGDKPPAGRTEWFRTRMLHYHQARDGNTLLAVEGIKNPADADKLLGVEPATEAQKQAYKVAQEIANSDKLRIDGKLGPGDFVVQHNLHTFHSREAYTDFEEADKKRHMLRLWLASPLGWPLDQLYADRWGSAEVGLRGGVLLPKTKPHITVDPLDAIAELAESYD